jgi:HD superfamily phosphohydrolase YqeK
MIRVSELMGRWALELGMDPAVVERWRATGLLHDALRDGDPEGLRKVVPAPFRDLPPSILHAPAAAERLRREGVEDEELLLAVAFHPLGHPRFGSLGRMLYAADFLEPGRSFRRRRREGLRRRMPRDAEAVVREVATMRICWLLEEGKPLHPIATTFWNSLVTEAEDPGRGGRGRVQEEGGSGGEA